MGATVRGVHRIAQGTKTDPRSPGDYDDICDECNYAKGF
jgi:hypothetical protein